MRKWIALIGLGMALFTWGCAGTGAGMKKDTKIKCPKCGVEFPASEGMTQ